MYVSRSFKPLTCIFRSPVETNHKVEVSVYMYNVSSRAGLWLRSEEVLVNSARSFKPVVQFLRDPTM